MVESSTGERTSHAKTTAGAWVYCYLQYFGARRKGFQILSRTGQMPGKSNRNGARGRSQRTGKVIETGGSWEKGAKSIGLANRNPSGIQ
ncbi:MULTISPECIES: hypothetical protein [unclassified Sphingobacterium]|uniref:hypothetical protein n=1 Tax=unclassified Sphingobacterium TaxID=2609468 RepID=UPI0025F48211|nr:MULTISPECIES: hypothetical protein [unclassified Sphingobacterium]